MSIHASKRAQCRGHASDSSCANSKIRSVSADAGSSPALRKKLALTSSGQLGLTCCTREAKGVLHRAMVLSD